MATIEKLPQYMSEAWLPKSTTGLWTWFIQRITAALLIIFILAHFWVTHFAVPGEEITFRGVTARLQSPFFLVLDSLLLATAIYHGLNGVRNVIYDFNMNPAIKKTVAWVLLVIGIVTFVYGLNALVPFITGRPMFPL